MILGGSYFQRLCDLQCVGEVRNCWFSRMRLVPQLLPRLLLQGRKAGQKASGCVGKRVGRPPAVGSRVGRLPSVSEGGSEGPRPSEGGLEDSRASRKVGLKASGCRLGCLQGASRGLLEDNWDAVGGCRGCPRGSRRSLRFPLFRKSRIILTRDRRCGADVIKFFPISLVKGSFRPVTHEETAEAYARFPLLPKKSWVILSCDRCRGADAGRPSHQNLRLPVSYRAVRAYVFRSITPEKAVRAHDFHCVGRARSF